MKIKKRYREIIELNLAVLFISTSAILAKHIDLPVPILIFCRAFIAALVLYIYSKLKGFSFKLDKKSRINYLFGGVLLGAHWLTYFYAIKYSNVAIGMLSLYTFPALTAILEPVFLKKKFHITHLILALIVLFGIYLLAPTMDIENDYFIGMCFGLLSALFFSIRNIMLKSKENSNHQSVVMTVQLMVVSLLLSPTLFFLDSSNLTEYWPSILLLGLLPTAIGHTLFVTSLSRFSTTSASLISSLQPIFGIILAFIFLSEAPSLKTILGGMVIISSVVIETIRISRSKQ
jgi:drug/metabolite transporter (DMT)-like permease